MIDLRLGDCLEVMGGMSTGSVDAILADPPYGTGQWLRPGPGHGKAPKASYSHESWDVWGLDWLVEARRICRGPIAYFLPSREVGSAIRHAETVDETWRILAWCKPDPMPMFSKQVAYGFEPIILLRHERARGGKDWCLGSTPRRNRDRDATGHPHQKPIKVASWLCEIITTPEMTILDPFMGSGTTGVACATSGRGFIGIESDPTYFEVARKRIAAAEVARDGMLNLR
jgi:site-specific DNA-methyltransferase (adenine-specific)